MVLSKSPFGFLDSIGAAHFMASFRMCAHKYTHIYVYSHTQRVQVPKYEAIYPKPYLRFLIKKLYILHIWVLWTLRDIFVLRLQGGCVLNARCGDPSKPSWTIPRTQVLWHHAEEARLKAERRGRPVKMFPEGASTQYLPGDSNIVLFW